jgi:enoyl-CoA hydratase
MAVSRTTIRLERDDPVATLWLDPPGAKPPTLSPDVLDDLAKAVDDVASQPPRVLVIRSASRRYFCVGADVHVLRQTTERSIGGWVEHGHRVLNRIEDLPCPVVACVTGYALGGGLELALACDVIFADASARLGLTEACLGFIPGWGGGRRLAERVGDARAKLLFFGGRHVDAREAMKMGLVEVVASDRSLDQAMDDWVAQVCTTSRHAVTTFKKVLADGIEDRRRRNLELEATHSVGCLKDPQTRQRVAAFLNRKASS